MDEEKQNAKKLAWELFKQTGEVGYYNLWNKLQEQE
jgi:hypothetical protein